MSKLTTFAQPEPPAPDDIHFAEISSFAQTIKLLKICYSRLFAHNSERYLFSISNSSRWVCLLFSETRQLYTSTIERLSSCTRTIAAWRALETAENVVTRGKNYLHLNRRLNDLFETLPSAPMKRANFQSYRVNAVYFFKIKTLEQQTYRTLIVHIQYHINKSILSLKVRVSVSRVFRLCTCEKCVKSPKYEVGIHSSVFSHNNCITTILQKILWKNKNVKLKIRNIKF